MHLNEGHPALAALELAAEQVAAGASLDDALAAVRAEVVFTTHTPVPAGNETYEPDRVPRRVRRPAGRGSASTTSGFLGLCRVHPDDPVEAPGLTPLRPAAEPPRQRRQPTPRRGRPAMWQPLFGQTERDDVPIGHVTNGVHLPTFMAPPMRRLLDAHLGAGWADHASDPAVVARRSTTSPPPSCGAPGATCGAGTIERVRRQSVQDRLLRGEQIDYVEAAAETLSDDALTIGFARRIATYKRLHLLTHDPTRALAPARSASPGAAALRRQGPPDRRAGQADRAAAVRGEASTLGSAGGWRSSRTTTCRWRPGWSPGATCGSTCPDRRTRPAARAA